MHSERKVSVLENDQQSRKFGPKGLKMRIAARFITNLQIPQNLMGFLWAKKSHCGYPVVAFNYSDTTSMLYMFGLKLGVKMNS
jgi:hypothetical protein